MENLKKVMNSFMNEHNKNFDDYFYSTVIKRLENREDYVRARKKRTELMEKYPRIMELFDRDHIKEFSKKENEAMLEIIRINDNEKQILKKEAFKLGFREAYIFFEEQGMLNI